MIHASGDSTFGDHALESADAAGLWSGRMPDQGPIVVFDTDCVLCSGMVGFVLAHEAAPRLRFAGAWSEPGLAMAARHGFTRADLDDTFLLVDGDRVLARSDAGLALLRHLRAPWRWLEGPLRLVPRGLRDAVYGYVAKRRYRWFGHKTNCTLVPPAQRHRFIGV